MIGIFWMIILVIRKSYSEEQNPSTGCLCFLLVDVAEIGRQQKISKSKERLLDKNHWNHPNFDLPNVPVFLFYVDSFNKIIYVEGNSQSVFPRFLAPRKGVNCFLNLNFLSTSIIAFLFEKVTKALWFRWFYRFHA